MSVDNEPRLIGSADMDCSRHPLLFALRLFAVVLTSAVAIGLSGITLAVAACTSGNPGVGCALPEYEEAKAPTDVSQLAGKDAVSVTRYGGNLVVEATDVSVPSIGAFSM